MSSVNSSASVGLEDVIYFAGLFDGEGCITVVQGHLRCSISQKDIRPLRDAKALWGGSISIRPDASCWELASAATAVFLATVRPYLRVKGEQAEVALALYETKGQFGSEVSPQTQLVRLKLEDRLRLLKKTLPGQEVA